MAIVYRLFHHQFDFFKNQVGSSLQVPADSITVTIFRQGARVSSSVGSGGSGVVVIPVYDPGHVGIGDTIQINAAGSTGTVGSITATSITTSSTTGALTFGVNDRVVITSPAPTAYRDDQAQQTLSPVISNATGRAECYTFERVIDYIPSGSGISPQLVTDVYGQGVVGTIEPFNIGAKFDGSVTDTLSFTKAIARAKALGKQEIIIPPGTALIDDELVLDGVAGLRVKGHGPGLSVLRITNTSKRLFYLSGSCSDVIFEDLSMEGTSGARTVPLLEDVTSSFLSLRHVRLKDGGNGIKLTGTDAVVDDLQLVGAWNGVLVNLVGATRPHLNRVRGSLGGYTTAITLDGATVGALITGCDFVHSSGNGIGLLTSHSSVSNLRVQNSRFSGGGAQGVVLVLGNSLSFENVICSDSLEGFLVSGGIDIQLIGCRALRSQNRGYHLSGGTHVRLVGCASSDANQSASTFSHCEIAGAMSDVEVLKFKFGNFAGGSGAKAVNGVLVNDGAGARVFVDGVTGAIGDVTAAYVSNNKANTRAQIYVDTHGLDTTGNQPLHSGFAFTTRHFSGNEGVPNIEGVNYITLSYSAGISITNFAGGTAGTLLFVTNIGANSITIVDGASTIQTSTGANKTLAVDRTMCFFKSSKATRNWEEIVVDGT